MSAEEMKDDFSAAFDRLAELGEAQNQTAPVEQPPQPESNESPAPDVSEQPAEEAAPEVETETEEPVEEEAPKQLSDEELLAKFAEMIRQPQQESKPAPAPTQEAPTQEQAVYTPEEQAFLAEYEKDWPDVAKAEALRRRAEYRELVGYVFNEIAREFGPLMENMHTLLQRTQLQDIREKVQDYDTVRDNVLAWVEKQPAYLQSAYKHVIQQGTPDEIADLVGRYKREVGGGTTSSTTRKSETELPSATKQAAASLAPVSSKRSAVIQGTDPNDFDGAFSEFAKML